MYGADTILCACSAYDKKYYLNPDFEGLPDLVKDELKIMCVMYTEEAGGILTLVFDDDGNLDFLIEYQGIQHYEAKSKFGGYTGLRKQQYNDMKKREYCKHHGYKLIAIPYNDEFLLSYDYIMSLAGY